jgi:subtilisin family serine protease
LLNPRRDIFTQQSGIVAAVGDNGKGVAGMVPEVTSGVEYLFARIYGESGNAVRWSDALAGIEWSLDNEADVIHLSFSGGHSELAQRLVDIAKQNGVILVAGSGNSGLNIEEFPSSYPSVISVGSVGQSK